MLPLDLISLASVRAFADTVKARLGSQRIDMLVLNAALQFPKTVQHSADGFEATFAVNHLAHYLLARLLLPSMAEGGRLVITTSDTHDPKIFFMGPKVLDTGALAHPGKGGFGAEGRAYPASKLCNILTARALAAHDGVKSRGVTVIAYNPGFTLGTSLIGNHSPILLAILRPLFGFVSLFNSTYYPGKPERSGEILAQLMLGAISLPSGQVYCSLVRGKLTFPDPSELASSDEARDRLWRESAPMVALPE